MCISHVCISHISHIYHIYHKYIPKVRDHCKRGKKCKNQRRWKKSYPGHIRAMAWVHICELTRVVVEFTKPLKAQVRHNLSMKKGVGHTISPLIMERLVIVKGWEIMDQLSLTVQTLISQSCSSGKNMHPKIILTLIWSWSV